MRKIFSLLGHMIVLFALRLLYHVCMTPPVSSQALSPFDRHGTAGTTAVAHDVVPFVAATDGASVFVGVCGMFPVDLGNRNEHTISREVQ